MGHSNLKSESFAYSSFLSLFDFRNCVRSTVSNILIICILIIKYLKEILFCWWFHCFLNYLGLNFIWGLFLDKKFCKNLFSQKPWRCKKECQRVNISNRYIYNIIYSIRFTIFQKRNFVVIQTKFIKHNK